MENLPRVIRNQPLPEQSLHSLYTLCVRLLSNAKRTGEETQIASKLCEHARDVIRQYAGEGQRQVRASARVPGSSGGGMEFLRFLLEQWNGWERSTVSAFSRDDERN